MPAKEFVNNLLTRVTGHHLAKGAPGTERVEVIARNRSLRGEMRNLEGELRRVENELELAKKSPQKRAPTFGADYDGEMKQIIRAVRGWTMTNNEKLFALISAVRYVVRNQIPGDIVECGVWRGGSMQAVARTLIAAGDTSRELHLFDTFEGMPPPSESDVRWDGQHATQLLETQDENSLIWAIATLEDVQHGFESVDYPKERLHFVKGKVEDTVPEHVPDRISILRLDTDWYESSLHELDHMYDRLVPGGVLLLDDYGYWEGQRRATDEWLERTREPLLMFRMSTGRAAVKPWK
ncbi:MAG: TylF/MycF/NovP-related O-methyltransferase [Jatrophihabitantaceae bacterium]